MGPHFLRGGSCFCNGKILKISAKLLCAHRFSAILLAHMPTYTKPNPANQKGRTLYDEKTTALRPAASRAGALAAADRRAGGRCVHSRYGGRTAKLAWTTQNSYQADRQHQPERATADDFRRQYHNRHGWVHHLWREADRRGERNTPSESDRRRRDRLPGNTERNHLRRRGVPARSHARAE